MDSLICNQRYIYDPALLVYIKLTLEAVLLKCQDLDHSFDIMINTMTEFVNCSSKKSSEATSNFDDDGVAVSRFDSVAVDDASSAAVANVATSTVEVLRVLIDDEFPMTVSVVANKLVPITDSSGHVHNTGYAPYSIMDNFTATHSRHDEVLGKHSYMLLVEDWGVVSSEVFIRQHMVLGHSSFGCSYPCIRQGGCVVTSMDRFLCFDPGILPVIRIQPLPGYVFTCTQGVYFDCKYWTNSIIILVTNIVPCVEIALVVAFNAQIHDNKSAVPLKELVIVSPDIFNAKGALDRLHDAWHVAGVKHTEHEEVVSKCVDLQATIEDVSAILVVEDTFDYSRIDSSWPIDVEVLHKISKRSLLVMLHGV